MVVMPGGFNPGVPRRSMRRLTWENAVLSHTFSKGIIPIFLGCMSDILEGMGATLIA